MRHALRAERMMALHLRIEHGWGIRRIGKRLGLTDTEVKRLLGVPHAR